MFGLVKEIRDREGNLHFKRWQILATRWFSVYIHCIYKHDEDEHPHSHPWNFCSLILKGGYLERLYSKKKYPVFKKFTGELFERGRFSFAYRDRRDYHKVVELMEDKPVWTLVIAGKRYPIWGFLTEAGFLDNDTYRKQKWVREALE